MHFFLEPLNQYFNFKDRATRQQFWLFTLIYMVLYQVILATDVMTGMYDEETQVGLASTLYALGLFIPSLALSVRRLHDIGKSGWWLLLWLVPILGWIVLLVFYVLDSEKEENKYGVSPKYQQNTESSEPQVA
ncbi:DUF805 domain-containing protein [Thiomicrorhabdus sp. Kp2]|uniref:DUF805 domain-containing protein n=1 Tax=Thiomicrorhabdus sp. Kp2 TaxID=1123518 RepID=UPI00041B7126|nr:DUF805 domain-containing protein [Thiomicrorhabdus sp. Kp2]